MLHTTVAFTCCLGLWTVHAAQIDGLRLWSGPENTRLVFDISAPIKYDILTLANPNRVVIDLKNTSLSKPLPKLAKGNAIIRNIRSSPRNNYDYRVVLDLVAPVNPNGFLLKPTTRYGHRLVLDLGQRATESKIRRNNETTVIIHPKQHRYKRDVVVAIDAGHGGEDPGAVGRKGTKEKDVVLAIARKLEKLLKQEYGIRPIMIRQSDYYVSLRSRIKQARSKKADLFVSIHADAVRNRRAHGASVFVLSQRAATNEAIRWLETTQNNTDLLGGVSLDDKDDVLASVLLDLSQNASLVASLEVGNSVLSELKQVGNVHKNHVEHAGFVVLKSPDIPSILVETGFISNLKEERKLKNTKYQLKVARAIQKGVKNYFSQYPPPGTILATREYFYKTKKGDTLSQIAQQYNVRLPDLRSLNSLRSDKLKTGQILRIPKSSDS